MQITSFLRIVIKPAVTLSIIVALISLFAPIWVGLMVVIGYLTWQLFQHYRELKLFSLWLAQPSSHNVPSGHGLWADIFAALYALRRSDEKNEAQLAEWLARFQSTMSHLPDGIIIMDKSSLLEWCNPVAELHFGFDLERDNHNRLVNLVRTPLITQYINSRQYDTPTKVNYGARHLELTLINFEENRLILVSRDITESERVDQMRRDFIANASHELRTPLTVISGFLEYAQDGNHDLPQADREKQIKLMRRQAEHMTVLVQDMLTLSHLESDLLIDEVILDMPHIIEQILNQARALSNTNHIINATVEPVKIKGSLQEISSLISNLLYNAVRHTQTGCAIHITWAKINNLPTLIVKDTGQGIIAEHLPRLTERFYRVNKEQSRANKGTGLGLAIVKHVLIRHQAELKITSTIGQGSTFTAIFPKSRLID